MLWLEFHDNLCDDLGCHLQCITGAEGPVPIDNIYDRLFLIEKDLKHNGTSLSSYPSMPMVKRNWQDNQSNPFLLQQLAYNEEYEHQSTEDALPLLNADQCVVFD